MIYGELFAAEIDPECGGPDEPICVPGRWLNPLVMTCYLLVRFPLHIQLFSFFLSFFLQIFIAKYSCFCLFGVF